MRALARELRSLGYERTEQESPFDEDGTLWTNSFELVCDKTAEVIRKDESRDTVERQQDRDSWPEGDRHTYRRSNRTKLAGGYVGAYNWGTDSGDGSDSLFNY